MLPSPASIRVSTQVERSIIRTHSALAVSVASWRSYELAFSGIVSSLKLYQRRVVSQSRVADVLVDRLRVMIFQYFLDDYLRFGTAHYFEEIAKCWNHGRWSPCDCKWRGPSRFIPIGPITLLRTCRKIFGEARCIL